MTRKNAAIVLIPALVVFALGFAGCPMEAEDDDAALYKVILSSLANGSLGVTPPSALAGGVEEGTVITLTAQPAPGYQLLTDSLKVTKNAEDVELTPEGAAAYTFTLNGDVQVSAFFKLKTEIPIASGAELAKIGVDELYPLDGNYYLTANIDLAAFNPWTPIGTSMVTDNSDDYTVTRREFTGTFDGRSYAVENLRLDGEASYSGLFGYVQMASIKNLTIKLAAGDITLSGSGRHYIGGAAGFVYSTEITGVRVENDLTVSGDNTLYAGNVIGYALYSAPKDLVSTGDLDVSSEAAVYAGGLVGYAQYSSLGSGSDAAGSVGVSSDAGSIYAGGVIGYAEFSPVSGGTYTTGSVTVEANATAYGGGIVGYASSSAISGVSSGKNVSVTIDNTSGSANGGGVAGYTNNSANYSSIDYSTAPGSSVSNSVSSGTVSVITAATDGGSYPSVANGGGLVGYIYSSECAITDSRATGAVTVEGTGSYSRAGGIAGTSNASIVRSSATGNVVVTHNAGYASAATVYAGGLAGDTTGSGQRVTGSYATGNVSAEYTGSVTGSNVHVGGLLGMTNNFTISDSYAAGNVTARGPNVRAGGLLGYFYSQGVISRCYATGAVNGITDNVTAANNGVGGIAGSGYSNASTRIEYCAVLSPSVSISANSANVKRIAGYKLSTTLANNFALDTMTLSNNDGSPVTAGNSQDGDDGASKTAGDLVQAAYSDAVASGGLGWDFPNTWKWDDVNGRPILAWQ
jgi:hypothetical protein